MPIGPEQFTDDELKIVGKYGVSLKKRFIEFHKLKLWVNACTHCPQFVGPSHLYKEYTGPTATHANRCECFKVEYYCPSCDIRKDPDEEAIDTW